MCRSAFGLLLISAATPIAHLTTEPDVIGDGIVSLQPGMSIKLYCQDWRWNATFFDVTWRRQGNEAGVFRDGVTVRQQDRVLYMEDVSVNDTGFYECLLRNRFAFEGIVASSTTSFQIQVSNSQSTGKCLDFQDLLLTLHSEGLLAGQKKLFIHSVTGEPLRLPNRRARLSVFFCHVLMIFLLKINSREQNQKEK